MDRQIQHDGVDVFGDGITDTSAATETDDSDVTRFIPVLLFGISICLLVALLFLFFTALHLNHENMIFDMYNYLIWSGSLVLAVLVAWIIFRS